MERKLCGIYLLSAERRHITNPSNGNFNNHFTVLFCSSWAESNFKLRLLSNEYFHKWAACRIQILNPMPLFWLYFFPIIYFCSINAHLEPGQHSLCTARECKQWRFLFETKIQCSCYTGQMMHLWCDWADCEFIPGMWTILQLQFSSRYRVSQSMRQALMLYVEKYSESMGVDLQSPHGGGRYWSCNSKRHILCLRESAGRDERRTQGRPRTGAEEDNKPTKPNTHFKHKWKQSTN